MKRGKKRGILVLASIVALVLVLDRVTKHLVATGLREGQSWDIVPWLAPVFSVTHVTNTGAAFGLLPGWGDFFVVIAVVVIVAIIVYYLCLPHGQWLTRVALGLQLGGALGNLIDRLSQGFVIDFIDLNFWPLRSWPVFNLADSSIVVGVTLLALVVMWEERYERGLHQAVEGG